MVACAVLLALSGTALGDSSLCKGLPDHDTLEKALKGSVFTTGGQKNGGLDFNMWEAIVARDGTVCAVVRTGEKLGDQWPESRVIAAQKANAFSVPGFALSTANLWKPVQPGGSLYGLQTSNPVDPEVAYKGEFKNTVRRMMLENWRCQCLWRWFGSFYDSSGKLLGGLGVSGDTSCADHNIAWKTRSALKLDYVPAGASATKDDNIIYDKSNGFSHVSCGGNEMTIGKALPKNFPIEHKK